MFQVDGYKIEFKRIWHVPADLYVPGSKSGRYDTQCKITTKRGREYVGVAKLHPHDRPDRVIGKKIALRKALGNKVTWRWKCAAFYDKPVRTAIWKAFWAWVESWKQ